MECRSSLVEDAMMYGVLHLPNFTAQVAAQQCPEVRKQLFLLINGEPPTEIVFVVNKAARSLRIEVGMPRCLRGGSFPVVLVIRHRQ
jgi:protein ImuB